MSGPSLSYYSPEVPVGDLNILDLFYIIDNPELKSVPINNSTITTVSGSGFTSQSQIDNFLGTTDEFDIAAFNAAAVGGGDCLGIIINMAGQAKSVSGFCLEASFNADAVYGLVASAAADIVTVTSPGHDLETTNVITVFNTQGFTIPSRVNSANISVTVPVGDNNHFTFTAPGGAPGGGPGTLNYVLTAPTPGVILNSTYSLGRGVPTLVPSTPQNAVSVGAYGNIGVKIIAKNIDTYIVGKGVMSLKIFWKPK